MLGFTQLPLHITSFMKLSIKRDYQFLTLLNLLAMGVSAYLVTLHFAPELTDFCNFGQRWNCDLVNKSTYAELFGIPVAILGLLAYTLFFLFSLRGLWRDQKRWLPVYLFLLTGAVLFTLYLTTIEAFILQTYCLFCVVQQILILIELGLALHLYSLSKSHA